MEHKEAYPTNHWQVGSNEAIVGGRKMRNLHSTRCRCQATAELVISFVGLISLFLGLSQIALIGHRNVVNGQVARERAEGSLLGVGTTLHAPVRDWKNGDDGLSYTADDKMVQGGGRTEEFQAAVEQPVRLQELEAYAAQGHGNAITSLIGANSTASAADLKEGVATDSVELDRSTRYFLTGATQVSLTDKAYMPGIMLQGQKSSP